MRVLLKKDFTIELKSVGKVINVNDSMVSRLEVEVEDNFLLPGECLWVVFSKTKDNPTDDITKEIQLGTDNKTYSVAIPQGVVMQEGTWYFILSARKYYSEEKYFTRRATEPYEFTIKGGLWIDDATSEVVNNGTAQSLYEMATERLKMEQENAKDIVALQEDVSKAKTDILAESTDRQAMDTAISQAAQEARSRAEVAVASALDANVQIQNVDKEISSINSEIRQIQIDLATVKGIEEDFRNLDGRVRYYKASSISVSVDPLTYEATFTLHADGGVPISTAKIDLPTEELVIGGYYNEAHGNIVLTLRNGNKIEVSVRDLVDGLISTSQKGVANGVASLDANGKVPKTQLPDDIGSGGGVSEERVEELIDEKIGNIETALGSVIALQNSLIGGNV